MNDNKPDVTHVDVTIPGPTLEDALLRVYIAGLGSGFMSGLVNTGASRPVAEHVAFHFLEGLTADPIPRNIAVEAAQAAFYDDPSWRSTAPGFTPVQIHPHPERD